MPTLNKSPKLHIAGQTIPVLSVSPASSDHTTLQRLLSGPQWSVYLADAVISALALLRQLKPVPVVVCDQDLFPISWRDLLVQTTLLPEPPSFIVASRLADNYLWAEALNLGAYDVLAKPFDIAELTSSLRLAWLHSQRQRVADDPLRQVIKVATA
jgi:DNA-binding NtrC family response regulator